MSIAEVFGLEKGQLNPASAETIHVPRPQPPQTGRHILNLDNDGELAELADLLPDDPAYRALKADVDRFVDEYVKSWRPRVGSGRRDETQRNSLVNALAQTFHEQSGWRLQYQLVNPDYLKEYRVSLRVFLCSILVANDLSFPTERLARLRLVDRRWRTPRP